VIEAATEDIVKHFQDIIAVAFDTWIVNFDDGIVIENYHDGEIILGKLKGGVTGGYYEC